MSRKFRRIGLIGDIHSEHVLLERALDVLESRGIELICATGDVTDGLGSVDRCCQLIMSRKVVTVRGNHDRWFLTGTARNLPDATRPEDVSAEARAILERLPRMVEFETTRGRVLLCHGLGPNDMAKVGPEDFGYALEVNDELQTLLRSAYYRFVLNGHSHRRMVRHFGGATIVNAGTLKRDHAPCFFELDFEAAMALIFEFDASGNVGASLRVPLIEEPNMG